MTFLRLSARMGHMYYTITPTSDGGIVVLKNTGTSLLSITNIKITSKSGATAESFSFSYDPDMLEFIEHVNKGVEFTWNSNAVSLPAILTQLWSLLMQSLNGLFTGLGQW